MLQTLHAGRSSIQDIVSLTPPTTPNQIHPNQTPSSPAKTPASALTETHNNPEQRMDLLNQKLVNLASAVPTRRHQLRRTRQIQRRQHAAIAVGQLAHQRQLRRLGATLSHHRSTQLIRHQPGRSLRCLHTRHPRDQH